MGTQDSKFAKGAVYRGSGEISSQMNASSIFPLGNQNFRESITIKKSSSFYSSVSYPNFSEIMQHSQAKIPKTKGDKLQDAKVNFFPYNTIGFVAFENSKKQRNFSTGFLITSCLVLTAANPTLIRNGRDGSVQQYKPTHFMLGQGMDISIYQIIDYRMMNQYRDIMTTVNEQDYVHSAIKDRIATLKKAENYDYCLLKLKENIHHKEYLNLLGDYDGYGHNRIIGYNYEEQYEHLEEQDKQMVIGQFIYTNGYVCDDEKIAMDINVRNTVIGAPIIIKHNKKFVVIGLLIRTSIHKELNAGLLISNSKIEVIRNWIIQMNQFPKILIYNHRKSSHDSGSSRKGSLELSQSPQKDRDMDMNIKGLVSRERSLQSVQSQVIIPFRAFEENDFWSKDNFNSSKFQINNLRVKKIKYNGDFHQIVSKQPINVNRKQATCKVRVVQYGGKYAISIGLINQNRINKRYSGDFNQMESIGYWTFNYGKGKGRMFVGGISHRGWDESLFVKEGQLLIIKVNNEKSTTQWLINERQVAKFQLPQSLRNQNLYLYVAMQRRNDCIQYVK